MITERLDNITKIPRKYLTETPPPPKSIKIEITNQCNYRCVICPISTRGGYRKNININKALFKRIVQTAIDLKIGEIGLFFMGESMTNPDMLVKYINHIKRTAPEIYVFLTSNASLAKHPLVFRIMSAGLDSLKWSVNFYNAEQFKQMTGCRESLFEDVIENIRHAWKLRDRLGESSHLYTKLYASSIRYDDEQYEKMQEFLKVNILPYVDEHYWLPLYSMGSLATANEKEMGMQPIAGNPGRYDNPVPPVPCWTLFTEAHVMADGRVTACCADATGEWVMGNINTQSFMEIWHSEAFRALRREHLKGNVIGTKCEHCVIYK
jgi:radical SAM protein with 4Fe4S-binding SPASM domain